MHTLDLSHIAWHLARTRWFLRFHDRHALERWQEAGIKRFLSRVAPRAPFLLDHGSGRLDQIPITDKSTVMQRFSEFNTAGIGLADALEVAQASESSRDFLPTIKGLTVGLSSGTSGSRGIFLVSRRERTMWAGIMLARVLPTQFLRNLVLGTSKVRVAFFLRANSNLYTTVSSRRIDFAFYDLFKALEPYLAALQSQQPHILVAPARVLRWLAEEQMAGRLRISPARVISVAEVLEPDDAKAITAAFGGPVHQLYQCTEGFLGYTCEQGTIHLNEEFLHIEPEWLDRDRTRFVPIITDFSRDTQMVVRYRLNDVLRARATPCACGSVNRALDSIEGRDDDILWLQNGATQRLDPIFPDQVRHAMLLVQPTPLDYRIEQRGKVFNVSFEGKGSGLAHAMSDAINNLCRRLNLQAPMLSFQSLQVLPAHQKRRRIVCLARPIVEGACVR